MAGVHGRAFITMNGQRFNSKEGATITMGGLVGEPVVGDGGLAGPQDKYEAGKIEATFIATEGVSVTTLQQLRKANVSFDSDNGKSFVSEDAFNGPLPELSRDGIKVTIHGTFKEV